MKKEYFLNSFAFKRYFPNYTLLKIHLSYHFISFEALYFMFIIPSMVTMILQAFTNYFCHKNLGYANFIGNDVSNNIWGLAYLNFGEGWHNNHHCYPHKYTNKVKWWELDLAGNFISWVKQ